MLGLFASCQNSKSTQDPLQPVDAAEKALQQFDQSHARMGIGSPSDLQLLLGQSPINIPVNKTVKFSSLDPVSHYVPFHNPVIDNVAMSAGSEISETMRVNAPADNGSYITINDKKYMLRQFHFHRSSEHAIQGKKGLMEVHFVHVSDDGKIAVLGVLLQAGQKNEDFEQLIHASPTHAGESTALNGEFDPSDLLPNNTSLYYNYSGSLTTPGGGITTAPFLQGLTWIVFKQSQSLAPKQVHEYAELYEEENARPIQDISGRVIYEHVTSGVK